MKRKGTMSSAVEYPQQHLMGSIGDLFSRCRATSNIYLICKCGTFSFLAQLKPGRPMYIWYACASCTGFSENDLSHHVIDMNEIY